MAMWARPTFQKWPSWTRCKASSAPFSSKIHNLKSFYTDNDLKQGYSLTNHSQNTWWKLPLSLTNTYWSIWTVGKKTFSRRLRFKSDSNGRDSKNIRRESVNMILWNFFQFLDVILASLNPLSFLKRHPFFRRSWSRRFNSTFKYLLRSPNRLFLALIWSKTPISISIWRLNV